MPLVDEDGRLFGLVNVVDLFAVLAVAAVVVAGLALAVGPGTSAPAAETGERLVTLDLGRQPGYVVDRIDAGDAASVGDGPGNLTLTDVYVTPAPDGDGALVTVRARVVGPLADGPTGETVTLGGAPLRLGRTLSVATAEYRVEGTLTAADRSGDALPVGETRVVLSTTVPAAAADRIGAGDRVRVAGRTLASVESVTAHPAADPTRRRLLLGLALRTVERGGERRFAGAPVRVDRSLSLPVGPVDIDGRIDRVGALAPPGEITTVRAVLLAENRSPERARGLRVGLTERVGETRYATVVDRRVEPATVVLRSQDGDLFLREHPRNVDVYLTVDLRARRTAAGLTVHGAPLRAGDRLTLTTERRTVRAEVLELRRGPRADGPTNATAVRRAGTPNPTD